MNPHHITAPPEATKSADVNGQDLSLFHRKHSHHRRRKWILWMIGLLVLWLAGVMIYQTHKPLPAGISYESPVYTADRVYFWHDLTYQDQSGTQQREDRSDLFGQCA
ncbi:hypothetical protein [Paenibacillus jilunlii]|uniref:hypothetical protein n=1 Tax=Paenibacillus jilunlii TaxID=682956 RepID=UPI001FCBCD77|nr:hypothetical protein [Paenibacillus jilunlii]